MNAEPYPRRAEAHRHREGAETPGPHDSTSWQSEVVHCGHCDDVIGVYEPLIAHQEGSEPVLSSLAIDPALRDTHVYYHHSCYITLDQPQ